MQVDTEVAAVTVGLKLKINKTLPQADVRH